VKFIDIHTHSDYHHPEVVRVLNIRAGVNQAGKVVAGPVSIGLHPWDIELFDEIAFEEIICQYENLGFIGECGLDKFKGGDYERQLKIFMQHAWLAKELHKPMIIHCVGYFNEMMSLIKRAKPAKPWIVHGFRGNPALTRQLINAGFYLSFGTSILREGSNAACSLAASPINRLFLETDNGEVPIGLLYSHAARVLGLSLDELKENIYLNFKQITS